MAAVNDTIPMNTHAETPAVTTSRAASSIVWAGLACGAMDITAAFMVYGYFGAKPLRLLQGIASGLLGSRSFSGGAATAALGLFCHFFIAFAAATIYFVVSRKVRFLLDHAFISGVLYGPLAYFFMQLVVVPLSAIGRGPFSVRMTIIGIVIHIVCVGLPISLLTAREDRVNPRLA